MEIKMEVKEEVKHCVPDVTISSCQSYSPF